MLHFRVDNKVRLPYSGQLIQEFELPPIVGLSIVRHVLLGHFREMLGEITRRHAESNAVQHTDS